MDYSQQNCPHGEPTADKIRSVDSIGTHTVLGKRGAQVRVQEFKRYMSDRFSDCSDNWCLPVAQAPVERIKFKGFVPYDDVARHRHHEMPDRNDFERGLRKPR
ncbi:MAG: hypothetical protein ACLS6O_09675 [Bifidobacterium sp.]